MPYKDLEKARKCFRESSKRWREAHPDKKRASNEQRVFFGQVYIGSSSFSDQERREMLDGKAD